MQKYKALTTPIYEIPKTLQQTIPVYQIAEDGIFLLEKKKGEENKRFDKAYLFSDTNYSTLDENEKVDFLKLYCGFLNSMNVSFKIIVMNNNRNMEQVKEDILIRNENTDFSEIVNDINNNIKTAIEQGRNGIEQEKLFIITCERQSYEHARDFFRTIEATIISNYQRMGSVLLPLDAEQRLKTLHNFYRLGKEEKFHFNFQDALLKKSDWRNSICNSAIKLYENEKGVHDGKTLLFDDRFVRVLYARDLPNGISDEFLKMLTSVSFHTITTLDAAPVPKEIAKKRLLDIYMDVEKSINKQQQLRNKMRNYSSDITFEKRKEKEQIEEYLNILTENDENMFYMGLYVVISASSKEELENNVLSINTISSNYSVELEPMMWNQLNALNTALPTGARLCNLMRPIFVQPLAGFMPFNVQELHDKGGTYYGINRLSKNVIVGDRKKLKNPHGFILGTSGGGKGFDGKNEISQVHLNTKDDIIVIDPQEEYRVLADVLKGAYINVSSTSNNHINALDVDMLDSFESEEAFIADKVELMLGITEQILEHEIKVGHKSIVDRCVSLVYRDYFSGKTKNVPTMVDFTKYVKEQRETEARELKLAFEMFVEGSLNTFAQETNVNIKNRFVLFGMKDLGPNLSSIGQMIMMESIRKRVMENYEKGKATWIFMDEFHNLTKRAHTISYLEKNWKEFRKFGGICTGITQNISDLLQTKEIVTMLSNSEYISILTQSEVEIPLLRDSLGLSEHMLEYVAKVEPGLGLLKFGNKFIPRDSRLPKDTPLYNLFNTDFHEKVKKKAIKEALKVLPYEDRIINQ